MAISMKNILRLEELAQFLLCLALLIENDVQWWGYLMLLIGPDIGMLGYLVNPRVGAISYNLLHHKAIGLLFCGWGMVREAMNVFGEWLSGIEAEMDTVFIVGLILYGHASMDRIFGYGLKFGDNFHHTHLGWIGKRVASDE